MHELEMLRRNGMKQVHVRRKAQKDEHSDAR